MADIAINKSFMTKGKVSIGRALDTESSPARLVIEGKLAMHRYIDDIHTIESERYKLEGVNVFREDFGSDDFNIIYSFTARELIVKGGESILEEDEIKAIEDKLYGDGGDE